MRPEVAWLILRIPNKFVLEAVKYDPKSRKARTLFARQAFKNHFVVLMSAGLMNNVLKRAKTYEAIPARTLGMYKDMLLAVSRAGMVLDEAHAPIMKSLPSHGRYDHKYYHHKFLPRDITILDKATLPPQNL